VDINQENQCFYRLWCQQNKILIQIHNQDIKHYIIIQIEQKKEYNVEQNMINNKPKKVT
jgi:hypothetical protein